MQRLGVKSCLSIFFNCAVLSVNFVVVLQHEWSDTRTIFDCNIVLGGLVGRITDWIGCWFWRWCHTCGMLHVIWPRRMIFCIILNCFSDHVFRCDQYSKFNCCFHNVLNRFRWWMGTHSHTWLSDLILQDVISLLISLISSFAVGAFYFHS